jgi:hypothetical protein
VKSTTDIEDPTTVLPKRATPKSDTDDPMREKLLRERDDPRVKKSSKDNVDPIRETPQSENADPRRAKERKDMDDPKCKKSNTESAEAKRE